MNDSTNVWVGLSHKNKTELRDLCKTLSMPLSGHETKPQLSRKVKEVQAEPQPLRQATLDFGRHQGKTNETVLRVGSADGPRGRCYSVATAAEVRDARGTVTGNFAEGDEFTSAKVACNVKMMNEGAEEERQTALHGRDRSADDGGSRTCGSG